VSSILCNGSPNSIDLADFGLILMLQTLHCSARRGCTRGDSSGNGGVDTAGLLRSKVARLTPLLSSARGWRINPYAKGKLKLLEIPTSAVGLPLMSSLNSVSVTATKATTVLLKWEADLIEKPIVYQCHHEDFIHYNQPKQQFSFTWRSILPNERSGIALRWAVLETDGDVLYRRSREFLAFLKDTEAFRFHTVNRYLEIIHAST
jgi:hypothetical protein